MNNKETHSNWHVKPDAQAVAETAKDLIIASAKEAIQKRGVFKLVLAGGTTPEAVYALLAQEVSDWTHWQLYLGDERHLPVNDPERNSQMVTRILLEKTTIPKENIHFIPAEMEINAAAANYEAIINVMFPFDMVLLGMGEDGHTASLFPGHSHPQHELVHAVIDAPKPPSERVSLSVKALSQNTTLLMLITGAGKHDAITQWRNNENLPVSQITSLGDIFILVDKDAWFGEQNQVNTP